MTKPEFIQYIAGRLSQKHKSSQDWADLVAAVGQATLTDKTALVNALVANDSKKAGECLKQMTDAYHESNALTEATAMLVDDNLTLIELNRVFGDG